MKGIGEIDERCWCGEAIHSKSEQFCSGKCRNRFKRYVGRAMERLVRYGVASPYRIRVQLEKMVRDATRAARQRARANALNNGDPQGPNGGELGRDEKPEQKNWSLREVCERNGMSIEELVDEIRAGRGPIITERDNRKVVSHADLQAWEIKLIVEGLKNIERGSWDIDR